MRLEERPVAESVGTILAHNVADSNGKKTLKKGTRLEAAHLARLTELGYQTVAVAVLGPDDVHEDEAAAAIGAALRREGLRITRAVGGRVNLHSEANGMLMVDAERLLQLNLLPGITLATRAQHALVGPNHETTQIATLKIIPYAVARGDFDTAIRLASAEPGMLTVRPLRTRLRAALLLTGERGAHEQLRDDFERPVRARLERLGAILGTVEAVPHEVGPIREAALRLAALHDLLIVAGQTSIMDEDDITPAALRAAGAEVTLHGAPVEPGNLLALAYFPQTPVLCAPGCARSLSPNVIDMVLPRLLLGERLGRAEIARYGLGGLLEK